jgi:iron complex transport system ATP-binding protein
MDGRDIAMLSPREFAQRLGILFQEHAAPGDLTVEELLYHGRHPHRRTFESLLTDDDEAVLLALQMAGLEEMRHRPLIELSGGERQLAWIAMLLAQSPNYLLLDEPTTFLDLAHQFDVMDLVLRLNRTLGKTVIMVVHDVNLAARYADYVFALRDGKIAAFGSPREVLSTETLRRVFDIEAQIVCDGDGGRLHCIPIKRAVRQ